MDKYGTERFDVFHLRPRISSAANWPSHFGSRRLSKVTDDFVSRSTVIGTNAETEGKLDFFRAPESEIFLRQ